MKALFGIAAVLTLLLGVVWLFFPESMFSSWGVQPDALAIYMARRYGGLLFGYSAILWMARATQASPARTAILAGGAIVTGLMTMVSLVGVLSGVVGPVVWSAVAIEAALAGGFSYYWATGRA
jgi:hypothetical protein